MVFTKLVILLYIQFHTLYAFDYYLLNICANIAVLFQLKLPYFLYIAIGKYNAYQEITQ